MQVCTTLGMVNDEQAQQLRQAGLTAYNHNLDTSPEYYSKITSTRRYEVCPPSRRPPPGVCRYASPWRLP
jgi:molybdenum cofactor biosynthesis enzyme MoaA